MHLKLSMDQMRVPTYSKCTTFNVIIKKKKHLIKFAIN